MNKGQRIYRARIRAQMTLEEVARQVGISRQTMSRYETGVIGNIPSDKIEMMSRVMNTSPAYLMGWEDEEALDMQGCTINGIAAKIKALRQQHHLTLEQVAQTVGVTKSTVRKWETGMIASMRQDKVIALARALHTTPAYLMGWEEKQDQCDIVQSFCDRFREYRQMSGETLESLSKKLGIPVQTLNRYELKQSTPKVDLVADMAKKLCVNPLWLLGYNVPLDREMIGETPQITSQERDLIALYRRVPEEKKDLILQMIRIALAIQE